jgi:hypothetical protein
MNYKDFLKQLDEERAAHLEKSWYIRDFTDLMEFLWYRVILGMKDWPFRIKMFYQRLTRGYSNSDIWSLNHFIVAKLRAPIHDFYRYEAEHGHSLPQEFQTDPAAWLVVLSKIDYAFDHEWRSDNEDDYNFTENMTEEQKKEHYAKVDEGFQLFGKFLRDLWD